MRGMAAQGLIQLKDQCLEECHLGRGRPCCGCLPVRVFVYRCTLWEFAHTGVCVPVHNGGRSCCGCLPIRVLVYVVHVPVHFVGVQGLIQLKDQCLVECHLGGELRGLSG